uniref:Uncharacterized protein n=1 Tax=Anguilla anguilla TaxID=7936 RepID=A0A0E9PH91_ANGAN
MPLSLSRQTEKTRHRSELFKTAVNLHEIVAYPRRM